ncbi:carboxyl-terminal-processing peptidase 2, chloroplastic isoform X3 [Gastrolobium bilobum]|uniref:carboxyl-terminal-processing peptidase 2, chloroplastic isoform X3 n=1 Tax=Gastrolobium bilobum TaxID=150636 RepID=UPI002AB138CA|nr:carboxyl-terminal-processing peptidase 2, chloroplastic isoform X3 [Gastrolobium bilobum]
MEVIASSVSVSFSLRCCHKTSFPTMSIPQVSQWKCFSIRIVESRFSLTHRRKKDVVFTNGVSGNEFSVGLSNICFLQCSLFPSSWGFHARRRKCNSFLRLKDYSVNLRQHASVLFVRLVAGVMLVMSVSLASSKPSYMAIRKMLATLDDPFTRFLEPEKFRSLRSGTQGALTGVGLSIGYPTKADMPPGGLVVVSASPGGPAYRAGVLSGDVILAIDDTSTENMGLYDAAERLQGPEGSSVALTIRSGLDVKHLALTREKVSLNPVKSRLCKLPASGNDSPTVGYIKLTSFNQKASRAVKEAINTLRSNNVNAFVLDLRDNSGGLFPEGIEIAKIWLDKGVIVYICDSRGIRDILDTDGSSALATSEPLAVLVNKGTASASEILAGALKDNKRAILFGEPTFGKGKIQSVFELSDGSGLVVTVARYETPAHTDIDKVGIIPDHPLPTSFPKDEDAFCNCLQDPASSCHVNRVQLFSK